jgi:PTS system nitrogen regulatory IIA component
MSFSEVFPVAHAAISFPAAPKPELIQDLAHRLCGVLDIDAQGCVRALLEREALGSTGMGQGTAIPHARLPLLREPAGFVVRLRKAIDFEAIDGRPVSVVCLLLLPAGDAAAASAALAGVARRFRDPDQLKGLRNAVSNAAFHEVFMRPPAGEAGRADAPED